MFSAIQTAFNIELYKLLTPTPNPDPVLIALERISNQLSSYSLNPPSINSTQPRFSLSEIDTPAVPRWAVWLNALWFSSLVFSLAAASFGLMVKQWLSEFSFGLSGRSRHVSRLRQLRLNSLERWRVKEIVNILPVLLQLASGLFFTGLLVLLWSLDYVVAVVGTSLVSVVVALSLCAIILPSLTTHCAYVSPPSLALFEIIRQVRTCFISKEKADNLKSDRDWMRRLFYKRRPLFSQTWRVRELSLLAKSEELLDGESVANAYRITMDTEYLNQATVCLTDLEDEDAAKCMKRIHSILTEQSISCYTVMCLNPTLWTGAIISLKMSSPLEEMDASWFHALEWFSRLSQMQCLNLKGLNFKPSWIRWFCVDVSHIIGMGKFERAMPRETPRLEDMIRRIDAIGIGNDVRQYSKCAKCRVL